MLNQIFVDAASNYKGEKTNEDYKFYFDNGCENEVIAFIYKNNFKLFHNTASRYIGIDKATLEDIILTQIWKCLSNFDKSKSKGKITTMICVYIRNECRRYTEEQNTLKQCINQAHLSTPFSAFDDPDRLEQMGNENGYVDSEIEQYLSQLDLTENQRKFCEVVLKAEDDITMADIAREIGLSRAGTLGVQRQLQTILRDLIA